MNILLHCHLKYRMNKKLQHWRYNRQMERSYIDMPEVCACHHLSNNFHRLHEQDWTWQVEERERGRWRGILCDSSKCIRPVCHCTLIQSNFCTANYFCRLIIFFLKILKYTAEVNDVFREYSTRDSRTDLMMKLWLNADRKWLEIVFSHKSASNNEDNLAKVLVSYLKQENQSICRQHLSVLNSSHCSAIKTISGWS